MMEAIIYENYGPPEVLRLAEVPTPEPKSNELLIRVRASAVSAGDARMRSFNVPPLEWIPARLYLGIFRPRRPILGMQLAGEVERVGSAVTTFKAGDAVYASCGLSFGGHAEYKCLPADGVVAPMPANLSFAEAAAVPTGGLGALNLLRKGLIESGQQVLIYGASGSVGTMAVQLASHYGAVVTGLCSTPNVELVTSLGAARVVDYTQEDLNQSGLVFDRVFDAVGKTSQAECRPVMADNSKYRSMTKISYEERADDLRLLQELLEDGKVRPVVTQTYPLREAAAAHRLVDSGHKAGNVVLTM